MVFFLGANAASAQTHSVRSSSFRRFEIISTQTGRKVSSDVIEKMMCQPTQDNLATMMDLMKNFDILNTFGDSSGGGVVFSGEQSGRKVKVLLFTDHENNNRLSYVWIDGTPVLTCE